VITGATAIQPAQASNAGMQSQAGITSPVSPQDGEQKTSFLANMSNTVKIALATVLGLAIVGVGILFISKNNDNNSVKIYNRLLAELKESSTEKLPTKKEEIELLLESLTKAENKDRTAVLTRIFLSEAPDDSYNVDKEITRYATSSDVTDETRETLFQIIGKRGNPVIANDLLQYALKHPDQTSSRHAITAAAKHPKEEDFAAYIKILGTTKKSLIRQITEQSIGKIIVDKSTNKNRVTSILIEELDSNFDDSQKLTMIRLLGTTGTNRAKAKIQEALQNSDTKFRIAAASAFSQWPNTSPIDALIEAIQTEKVTDVQRKLFDNAFTLLLQNDTEKASILESQWLDLSINTSSDLNKRRIIAHMKSKKYPFSISNISYFNNERHSTTVMAAARNALESLK